jgi:general stress protein 26
MASWAQFAAAEPEMAALGEALLKQHQLAYLATVRRDGAPRVHPVSPQIIEGRLFIATPTTSPKAADQIRDGRYALHLLPGEDDAEFRIRGRARQLSDPAEIERICAAGPHYFEATGYLFEYDIEEAATARWVNVGRPGTYAERRSWRASEK